MRLREDQAKKFLEEKPNSSLIAAAIAHDRRIRLHAEAHMGSMRQEHLDFLKWVKKDVNLADASFRQFEGVFTLPVPTTEISERIFEELSKVWDSDNGYTHLHCTDETHLQHAEEYLGRLNIRKRMQEEGWRHLQSAPSSLVVIDMPKEGEAQPYFYFLPIEAVEGIELEDVQLTGAKRVGAVSFSLAKSEAGHARRAVICDEWYRIFVQDDKGKWSVEHDAQHSFYTKADELESGLGYCPVVKLLSKPLTLADEVTSQSPISSSLGELDHLLYLKTAEKVEDSGILFPIMWKYGDKCMAPGCEGGIMYDETGHEKECPSCKAQSVKGPGVTIYMDVPTSDKPALSVPVGYVYPQVESLKHLQERIEAKEKKIIANAVGGNNEQSTEQAKNEDQIAAGFESKTATLIDLKGQLEQTIKFITDTTLKLMCQDAFEGSEISLGTRFFLKDENYLLGELKESKLSGAPVSYQTLIREEIQDARYRHDPERKARAILLSHLEPYPSLDPMALIANINYLDPIEVQIQLQFSGLIKRFEREYVPVQRYMPTSDLPTRVEAIKDKLKTYLTPIQKDEPDSTETTGPAR